MDADEAQFSVEQALDSQIYLWSDKYRPRKPRYFNRVHTGFEWNKYNQTHYDMDNPPPKIVQGYKFNIFYPDLIDKNNTPEYFLVGFTWRTFHFSVCFSRNMNIKLLSFLDAMSWKQGVCHFAISCWSSIRRHCLQDSEQGVGVFLQERV